MKLIIVLAVVALSRADKLDNTYLPPSFAQSSGGSEFLETPKFGNGATAVTSPYYDSTNAFDYGNNPTGRFGSNSESFGRQERTQAAFERNAAIIRQENVNDGGSYSYAFETENGIRAEESGVATNGVEAQGGYSYIGDDGIQYSVRYTADQNGFRPQGDHLPTPPPIPAEILKALEQNARDEAAGIYDDGSYNEGKYESNAYQPDNNQYNTGSNTNGVNHDDSIVTDSASFRNPNYQDGGHQDFENPLVTSAKTYLPPRFNGRYRY